MGHMLPHAFTARGSLILSLEEAVQCILSLLYKGFSLPEKPKSGKTPRQSKRNNEIKAKYESGLSVPDLAKEYSISINRVYQILAGKRR